MVVKIMVPLWVLNIIRHLVVRGPERGGHSFDNHTFAHVVCAGEPAEPVYASWLPEYTS